MYRPSLALACATLAGFLSVGCLVKKDSKKDTSTSATDATPWAFSSPDFDGGASMPPAFTCDGGDFGSGSNPELDWTDGPAAAKSYAVVLKNISIVEKMDATTSDGYQWAIWNIPATVRQIPQGLSDDEFPPEVTGARQWAKLDQFGYFPPCPNGDPAAAPASRVTDHYTFTLYALPADALAGPKFDPKHPNYVQTLDDYLKPLAIQELELLFTSDAASSSAPSPLDPSAIEPPSGVGEAGASGTENAGGAGGAGGASAQ